VRKQINDIPVHELLQLLDPKTYRQLEQQIALNWFSYNLFRSMRPGYIAFTPEIEESTESSSFEYGGNEFDHKPTCNRRNMCKCSQTTNNKPKLIQSTIDEYFKPESAREINREIKTTGPHDWPPHYYHTVGKNASRPTAGGKNLYQESSEETVGQSLTTPTLTTTTTAKAGGCKKISKIPADHLRDDQKWVKLYPKNETAGVPEVKKIVFVDRKSLLEME
jgi:hypothetical protein